MYPHEIIKTKRMQVCPRQTDFVKEVGMSLSACRKIEEGQIGFKRVTKNLERICYLLDLNPEGVINGQYEMMLVPTFTKHQIDPADVKRKKRTWSIKKGARKNKEEQTNG